MEVLLYHNVTYYEAIEDEVPKCALQCANILPWYVFDSLKVALVPHVCCNRQSCYEHGVSLYNLYVIAPTETLSTGVWRLEVMNINPYRNF